MRDRRDRFQSLLGRRRTLGQEHASLSDPVGVISVGEYPVMPDLDEARRQDVQTEAAKKLLQRQRHGSDSTFVGIIFVAKGDHAVLKIQSLQAAVGDSDPVSVAAQIRQDRLRTSKRPFGIDDPFVPTEPTQPVGKDRRI